MKFFNTAGPVNSAKHYCLDPLKRISINEIVSLISQEKYFILHAPRQTGKTTSLLAIQKYLNAAATYSCIYFNVEQGQSAREDVDAAMRVIVYTAASESRDILQRTDLDTCAEEHLRKRGGHGALSGFLAEISSHHDKPLVVLIDEVDSLIGDTLISFLRQIRTGYSYRPDKFPRSIILCGVRDVRDYRIHSSKSKEIITGGSAFNIKAASLVLGNLSRDEVGELLQQHTTETGQHFDAHALDEIWRLSRGQPWLVNALAYHVCFEVEHGKNRSRCITGNDMSTAAATLIERRDTHIDQLSDKLREPRVRRVVEPILAGDAAPEQLDRDDVDYVRDLGLITTQPQLDIANDIYREVIPRELTYTTQVTISHQTNWYTDENGALHEDKLLAAFQDFFRENAESWLERFDYKEAGPQLLLQAFLQRILNGGGTIIREYGLGRKRTDLYVQWPRSNGDIQKIIIECKLLYASREKTIEQGLKQLLGYIDTCDAQRGHLIIFDRDKSKSWDEKIFRDVRKMEGKEIVVWGM